MAQQKPKTWIDTCAKGMWLIIGLQFIAMVIFWITYAVISSKEKKNKPVVEEIKATVKDVIISAGSPDSNDVLSTSPPFYTSSYRVETVHNNMNVQKVIRSPLQLGVGDTITLYVVSVGNKVVSVSDQKPAPPVEFSKIFLLVASLFTASFVIAIAIKILAPAFACFIVLLNVFIIIIASLKGSKVI